MSVWAQGWHWLASSSHWWGRHGIAVRLGEHLGVSALALALAAAIAIPLGRALGRRVRASEAVLRITIVARAVPTLGTIALLGVLAPYGIVAPVCALVVLALPTLFVGALSSVQAGTSAPTITALRAAAVQIVSTATLCAYVSNVGLGAFLFDGLHRHDSGELFGCTVLIVVLVLVLDVALSGADRLARRRMA